MGKKRPHEEMKAQTDVTLPQPRAFRPDGMITLLVGPQEKAMVAHDDCLSRDSELFKAALRKEWREGQTHVVKLPEENPTDTGYYIEHLHGVELPTHKLSAGSWPRTRPLAPYNLLATLYVLGERILDAKFQAKIMNEFSRLVYVHGKTSPAN